MVKKQYSRLILPTELIKKFCDFFSEFIYNSINHCITDGSFIADFKEAEVRPLHENDRRPDKSSY